MRISRDIVIGLASLLPPLDVPPAHQSALHAAVEAARARQRVELQAAIDAALENVPRVLRGALRKVLFK